MKLQLNKPYLFIALALFIVELWIAIVIKTGFIRYTFGDYIVVILLHCLLKGFTNLKTNTSAILVLCIAFSIEILQYYRLLELLNLQDNTIAKLILGSTFQTGDLIAYTLGVATVILIEKNTLWKH